MIWKSQVELIKSLTGEDALDIERKNLAPLSSINLTARNRSTPGTTGV